MRPEWERPAGPDQVVCARPACGRGVWHDPSSSGRRPTLCPGHMKPPPDAGVELAALESGAAGSERSHQRRAKQRTEAAVLASMPEFAAMRMAIGLGKPPDDPRRAAQLAGVLIPTDDGKAREPTEAELEELVAHATTPDYKAIRDLSRPALVGLLSVFTFRNAISLMEAEPLLKPEQRAFAQRLIQQTIEDLGGKRAVYATYSVKPPRVRGAK